MADFDTRLTELQKHFLDIAGTIDVPRGYRH